MSPARHHTAAAHLNKGGRMGVGCVSVRGRGKKQCLAKRDLLGGVENGLGKRKHDPVVVYLKGLRKSMVKKQRV